MSESGHVENETEERKGGGRNYTCAANYTSSCPRPSCPQAPDLETDQGLLPSGMSQSFKCFSERGQKKVPVRL